MLLGLLGASLLENLFAGQGVPAVGGAIRAGEGGIIRLGQDFNATSPFD